MKTHKHRGCYLILCLSSMKQYLPLRNVVGQKGREQYIVELSRQPVRIYFVSQFALRYVIISGWYLKLDDSCGNGRGCQEY